MKNSFQVAKNTFLDVIDINEYIEIESSYMVMTQLENAIHKPFKMVILFGRPGTGKSILLKNLFEQTKHQKEMYFFETPSGNQKEFLKQLLKAIKKEDVPLDTDVDFVDLVDYCKSIKDQREIIFLLDEAQMYDMDTFEKIRLLSDTNTIKFIISLHQHGKEELLTQAHFSSRIWERIELKNITVQEQALYIYKKLSNKNLINIANNIKDKNLKLIYKYTKGNYRECNKLMYAIFEICEYYDKYNPLKMMNINSIPNKIIEMAGLKLGYINA
ncbi:MAG: AAA family ATPase [Sulfurovaceae bacterium]